jgi:hypothetical protein
MFGGRLQGVYRIRAVDVETRATRIIHNTMVVDALIRYRRISYIESSTFQMVLNLPQQRPRSLRHAENLVDVLRSQE